MPRNQQILLDNRPQGEATAGNFKLVATDTPALQDGQVLVRHHRARGRFEDTAFPRASSSDKRDARTAFAAQQRSVDRNVDGGCRYGHGVSAADCGRGRGAGPGRHAPGG